MNLTKNVFSLYMQAFESLLAGISHEIMMRAGEMICGHVKVWFWQPTQHKKRRLKNNSSTAVKPVMLFASNVINLKYQK